MKTKIYFTREEYAKCEQYADKLKFKFKCFMDKRNTVTRSIQRKYEDLILGKLSELAVQKYLINLYGIHRVGQIDFRVYEQGEVDEGDITLDGKVINIKSSKLGSHCLMIETARFKVNKKGSLIELEGKKLPDYFMFVRVDVENLCAEICGAITCNDFWNKKKYMPRGMAMYRDNINNYLLNSCRLDDLKMSNKGLLADNYGIHINILEDINKIHNIAISKKEKMIV